MKAHKKKKIENENPKKIESSLFLSLSDYHCLNNYVCFSWKNKCLFVVVVIVVFAK